MMDKDEAVQKLSKVARISVAHAEDLYDSFFEKPVVPQYVADWYEENKDGLEFNLIDWINKLPLDIDGEEFTEFDEWLTDTDNKPIQTLVDMHRLGYEVEKEKRYTVKLKNKSGYEDYLVDTNSEGLRFYNNLYTQNRVHTRKELEDADFGWVFDCPGVEVKEVTDE